MTYHSMKSFAEALDSAGELVKVKEFVSPVMEISEITDRFSKNDGKALLFENTGTDFPVLINAMGSESRMKMALQVSRLDEIGERLQELAGTMLSPRESFMSKLSLLPTLAGVASWMPRRISGRGRSQEVVMQEPDLSKLPVLTCWPHDGGPFITLPIVHTVHPETGIRNAGMYRMQVLGKSETGMHWHLHKGSASHFREYKRLGKKMPVAVALGGDPVYTYCATAPLPENVDEYLLAGFLRKKKVELVKCLTCDLDVPADADFILEGYVDPEEELVLEGPFGDHTGFYSLADYYPKFHITCITHRKDAVYPATIVGIPPQEDAWIGKATERIFLEPIRLSMLPELADMVMPVEGVFHNIVLAKIRKTYPGQAMKVMNSLWGAGQMMFNKILVILDEEVNLNDPLSVLKAIRENVDPSLDLVITPGPVDVLDHSSSRFAVGSKLGMDATRKIDGEGERKPAGVWEPLSGLSEQSGTVDYFPDTTLALGGHPVFLVYIRKNRKNQVQETHRKLADSGIFTGIQYVLYLDESARGLEYGDLVWLAANNIDPSRDCSRCKEFPDVLMIDGTMKSPEYDDFRRDWPNVIAMSEGVIQEIDRKWESLKLGPFLESPSLKYQKLVKGDGAVAMKCWDFQKRVPC